MSQAEIIELIVIIIISLVVASGLFSFPEQIACYQLVLFLSVLWFLQSLIRDLSILYKNKHTQANNEKIVAPCFCVESSIGMFGVLSGIILSLFLNTYIVSLMQWQWVGLIALVLATSFLIKDYVIELNSMRIYKEKNHINIIFSWKTVNTKS